MGGRVTLPLFELVACHVGCYALALGREYTALHRGLLVLITTSSARLTTPFRSTELGGKEGTLHGRPISLLYCWVAEAPLIEDRSPEPGVLAFGPRH